MQLAGQSRVQLRRLPILFVVLALTSSCYTSGPYRTHQRRYQRSLFQPHEREQSMGGAVATAVVDAITYGMAVSRDARAKRSSAVAASTLPARVAHAGVRPSITRVASPNGPLLRMRVPLLGGYAQLAALPEKYPSDALLSLHFVQRLAPAPCAARLYRDGEPLQFGEIARRSDYELAITVELVALRSLGESDRFAGELCGARFDFDEHARKSVAEFEAAVREERSALAAAGQIAHAQR